MGFRIDGVLQRFGEPGNTQDEARVRMETMIANLTEAYRQSITKLEWMSEETKQQALDYGLKV